MSNENKPFEIASRFARVARPDKFSDSDVVDAERQKAEAERQRNDRNELFCVSPEIVNWGARQFCKNSFFQPKNFLIRMPIAYCLLPKAGLLRASQRFALFGSLQR